jgi:hypothetical protein
VDALADALVADAEEGRTRMLGMEKHIHVTKGDYLYYGRNKTLCDYGVFSTLCKRLLRGTRTMFSLIADSLRLSYSITL